MHPATLAHRTGSGAYQAGKTTNDCPYPPGDPLRYNWFLGFQNASEAATGDRVEIELVLTDKVYLHVTEGEPAAMIEEAKKRCPGFRVDAVGERTLVSSCEVCGRLFFDDDHYVACEDCDLCQACYDALPAEAFVSADDAE